MKKDAIRKIAYYQLVKYKMNRHDDIHLIVGEKLIDILDYSPKTFQSIFLETMRNIDSPKLCDICQSLPFGEHINEIIYRLEMEAEMKYSVINYSLLPLSESVVEAPPYFTYEEIVKILKSHNIDFIGKVVFSGRIEDIDNNFDIFSFEKNYFGETVGELRFLRTMIANGGNEKTEDEKFFYNLGATVIAPVYVLYAEWIIRFCQKHSISILLPLMREATVLINCLRKLGELDCEPLYCSRRFLFNASINSENFSDKINQVLIKSKATPVILCNDIGLDGKKFSKFSTMADLKAAGVLDEFSQYLYVNRETIISYSNYQRKLFCKNLKNIVSTRKAATVDIGFSGTSESLIRDILKMQGENIEISHLILLGADAVQIRNIKSGLNIYSWLGMAGENTEITKRLMYQIQVIEPLINDICGTTLAYDEKGPVIDSIIPKGLEKNFPRALSCQRGISDFVCLWKRYRDEFDINKLLSNKVGFINIWRRLIETPTVEEAIRIGGLLLYDNYTEEKRVYSVKGDDDTLIEDCDAFLENISRLKSDYPQARVVVQNPNFFKEKLIEKMLLIPGSNRMVEIIGKCKLRSRNTAIFAAGQRGRDFLRIAKMFDINIVCFIDSDIKLHGKQIDGIPVIALKDADMIDVFINASYNYPDEVTQTILDFWGNRNPTIFTID